MPALRPLPPRPNLEFEHKEAKALLRRLRAGDPDAVARARERHTALNATALERIRLADAQLVIAREYGFTSWPRLVRYFVEVDRQWRSHRPIRSEGRKYYEAGVRDLLANHRVRRASAALSLGSYVPRFYGVAAEAIFSSSVTEDEARLVVARSNNCPSWEVLVERIEAERVRRPSQWDTSALQQAGKAMEAGDLDALKRVVGAHPELLHPDEDDIESGRTLARVVLHHDRVLGRDVVRPMVDWLVVAGLDLQRELNRRLCGHLHMRTDRVHWLLDRGADPHWIAPSDVPVLEHALIRYWNGEAVDLVAARTTPRRALWVAAGLGNVDDVRRFLDASGNPTPAARQRRPDFVAVGPAPLPMPPDPNDEQLLAEAFIVAMWNGRTAVLEYMVSRGFPVNSQVYGMPLINFAIGNAMPKLVECLVRCGADLDLEAASSEPTPRELARNFFESSPEDAARRRIAELCGLDLGVLLAERDARPVRPPHVLPLFEQALDLASDDARRLGQLEVRPENLLFGLLRVEGGPSGFFTRTSRMDFERFRADVRDRVHPAASRADGDSRLPMSADAQAAIDTAIAIATGRRSDTLHLAHLLYALTRSGEGPAAELLTRYGGSVADMNAAIERAL